MFIRFHCLVFYPWRWGRFVARILTYSMERSPSWEANWFSASQEIPRILWKVHYRVYRSPPPVSIWARSLQLMPTPYPTSWRSISISLHRISIEKLADIDVWSAIWIRGLSVRAVEVYWHLISQSLKSAEINAYQEKWRGRVIGGTKICYSSRLSLVNPEGVVVANSRSAEFRTTGMMLTTKIEPDFKLYVWSCNMAKWPKPYCSVMTTVT